jgi:hypothetical protein
MTGGRPLSRGAFLLLRLAYIRPISRSPVTRPRERICRHDRPHHARRADHCRASCLHPAKTNIVGLTRDQLREALIAAGTPEKQAKMRVGQVWQWVYHWGVRDFALMTNLAKDYRALLAENFTIEIPEVVTRQISGRWHPQISGPHRRRA